MNNNYDVIIVGAGIAGLMAAIELEKFNLKILVLEKADRVGGRIKTDEVDDFLLDHGFQIYLTAYPEGQDCLDYEGLHLKPFFPGAFCFNRDEKFTISDAQTTLSTAKMAFSPMGTIMDKVRLGNLSARLKAITVEDIFERPEYTTLEYLKQKGFSDKIISRFFKPFFSGVFLENDLNTSSRMFEFVFKMFAEGKAAVPAGGMEEIPKQLKAKLENTEFRFHTEVLKIEEDTIFLKSGESLKCEHIIVANSGDMVPQMHTDMKWRQTATYYFSADKSILKKNIIGLNYHTPRLVNNFTVITDTAKSYAPKNKHLVSVSLSEIPDKSVEEVSREIKNELAITFGSEVQNWQFIRNYHIKKALPAPRDFRAEIPFSESRVREGLYLAGDHLLNGSINGALKSGKLAAQAVIFNYNANRK